MFTRASLFKVALIPSRAIHAMTMDAERATASEGKFSSRATAKEYRATKMTFILGSIFCTGEFLFTNCSMIIRADYESSFFVFFLMD